MRWLALVLIAGGIAVGVFLGGQSLFGHRPAESTDDSPSVPQSPNAKRRIYALGHVEGTQREAPLRFDLSGRVAMIHVHEGDRVAKGDILVELDGHLWEQRVGEAEARLKLAKAERERLVNGASKEARDVLRAEVETAKVLLGDAEALFGRAKALKERNNISQQDYDNAKYKYERALSDLKSAKARLAEIEAPARVDDLAVADSKIQVAEYTLRTERAMLEKTRMRAPSDGLVLHIFAEAGEVVDPIVDKTLLTMVNRDRTRVRAQVEELDALSVVQGQRAIVTADGRPDKQYHGVVLSCAPVVRPKTLRHHKPGEMIDVKVREVVIELKDASDLVVGLPVDVFILPEGARSAPAGSSTQKSGPAPQVTAVERSEEDGL